MFRSSTISIALTPLLVVIACGCTRASAVDFSCPATLPSMQSGPVTKDGWQVTDSSAASVLQNVELLSGDPADNASLVPDDASKQEKIETVVWNLVPTPNEPFWVACTYTNTRLVLAKRIPDSTKQCVATYDLLPNGNRLRLSAVKCR